MKILRNEKGQSTVELAISITIFMIILFGIIDFGRIFWAYIELEHSGREAARVASLKGTDSEIVQIAKNSTGLDQAKLTVSVSPSYESRKRGTYVTVVQEYDFDVSTPFMNQFIPNPFTLKNKTTSRVE